MTKKTAFNLGALVVLVAGITIFLFVGGREPPSSNSETNYFIFSLFAGAAIIYACGRSGRSVEFIRRNRTWFLLAGGVLVVLPISVTSFSAKHLNTANYVISFFDWASIAVWVGGVLFALPIWTEVSARLRMFVAKIHS